MIKSLQSLFKSIQSVIKSFQSVIESIQSVIESIQSVIESIQSVIKSNQWLIRSNQIKSKLIFFATAPTRDWCRVYGLVRLLYSPGISDADFVARNVRIGRGLTMSTVSKFLHDDVRAKNEHVRRTPTGRVMTTEGKRE